MYEQMKENLKPNSALSCKETHNPKVCNINKI